MIIRGSRWCGFRGLGVVSQGEGRYLDAGRVETFGEGDVREARVDEEPPVFPLRVLQEIYYHFRNLPGRVQ